MTLTEMVERIAEAKGIPRATVATVLKAFIEETTEVVNSGESVVMHGFGSFFTQKLKKKPLFGEPASKGFWTTLRFQPSRERRGTWKSTP